MNTNTTDHKLYAIQTAEGRYFKGFDAAAQAPAFVDDVLEAKLFTNKYDVKLRPAENIVELVVTLSVANTVIGEPFRPRLRQKDLDKTAH